MGERWSPGDGANAAAAPQRGERWKNGPSARRRSAARATTGKRRPAQRPTVGRLAAMFLILFAMGVGKAALDDRWGPSASSLNGRCVTLEGSEPDRKLSEIRCSW